MIPQSLTIILFDVLTFAFQAFVDAHRGFPMKRQTVVTCIATLKKSHDEEKAVSCLILGVLKLIYSDTARIFFSKIARFQFKRHEFPPRGRGEKKYTGSNF